MSKEITFEELDEIVEELRLLDEAHWEKLDKYGYVDFPETEEEQCDRYNYKSLDISSWHESRDYLTIRKFVEWLKEKR